MDDDKVWDDLADEVRELFADSEMRIYEGYEDCDDDDTLPFGEIGEEMPVYDDPWDE